MIFRKYRYFNTIIFVLLACTILENPAYIILYKVNCLFFWCCKSRIHCIQIIFKTLYLSSFKWGPKLYFLFIATYLVKITMICTVDSFYIVFIVHWQVIHQALSFCLNILNLIFVFSFRDSIFFCFLFVPFTYIWI